MKNNINILMVCMGNICRSPMAAGIAKHYARKYKLDNIYIDSAGTHDYHIGNSADRRAIAVMKKHNIDISTHRARQINNDDVIKFDYIMFADKNNLQFLKKLKYYRQYNNKFVTMLGNNNDQLIELKDPYYGDDDDFEICYQQLMQSLEIWFEQKNELR